MSKIDIAAVPVRRGSGYPPTFDVPCAARTRRRVGDAGELRDFGVNLTTLPPGSVSINHGSVTQVGARASFARRGRRTQGPGGIPDKVSDIALGAYRSGVPSGPAGDSGLPQDSSASAVSRSFGG
jgi:hypothetical protein